MRVLVALFVAAVAVGCGTAPLAPGPPTAAAPPTLVSVLAGIQVNQLVPAVSDPLTPSAALDVLNTAARFYLRRELSHAEIQYIKEHWAFTFAAVIERSS